jgi:hypothetical protein
LIPPNLFACKAGLTCLAGTCRSECDLATPFTCPLGTACELVNGTAYCVPPNYPYDAGGGGSGGGGSTHGGGTDAGGKGTVISNGCGCSAGLEGRGWLLTLGLLALANRPRRGRREEPKARPPGVG